MSRFSAACALISISLIAFSIINVIVNPESLFLSHYQELFSRVPEGYYSFDGFGKHDNTFNELKAFLRKLVIPAKCKASFDCSECSAFVEWALQNAGFEAYIAHGFAHAWVIVKTRDRGEVAVEATRLFEDSEKHDKAIILPHSEPLWERYYKYDALSEDIYEAIKSYDTIKEVDWWQELGYPPKIGEIMRS